MHISVPRSNPPSVINESTSRTKKSKHSKMKKADNGEDTTLTENNLNEWF